MTREEFDRQFVGYMADLHRTMRAMEPKELIHSQRYNMALIVGELHKLARAVKAGEVK